MSFTGVYIYVGITCLSVLFLVMASNKDKEKDRIIDTWIATVGYSFILLLSGAFALWCLDSRLANLDLEVVPQEVLGIVDGYSKRVFFAALVAGPGLFVAGGMVLFIRWLIDVFRSGLAWQRTKPTN